MKTRQSTLNIQSHLLRRRYLDPQNIPKPPILRRYGWMSRANKIPCELRDFDCAPSSLALNRQIIHIYIIYIILRSFSSFNKQPSIFFLPFSCISIYCQHTVHPPSKFMQWANLYKHRDSLLCRIGRPSNEFLGFDSSLGQRTMYKSK